MGFTTGADGTQTVYVYCTLQHRRSAIATINQLSNGRYFNVNSPLVEWIWNQITYQISVKRFSTERECIVIPKLGVR